MGGHDLCSYKDDPTLKSDEIPLDISGGTLMLKFGLTKSGLTCAESNDYVTILTGVSSASGGYITDPPTDTGMAIECSFDVSI